MSGAESATLTTQPTTLMAAMMTPQKVSRTVISATRRTGWRRLCLRRRCLSRRLMEGVKRAVVGAIGALTPAPECNSRPVSGPR